MLTPTQFLLFTQTSLNTHTHTHKGSHPVRTHPLTSTLKYLNTHYTKLLHIHLHVFSHKNPHTRSHAHAHLYTHCLPAPASDHHSSPRIKGNRVRPKDPETWAWR